MCSECFFAQEFFRWILKWVSGSWRLHVNQKRILVEDPLGSPTKQTTQISLANGENSNWLQIRKSAYFELFNLISYSLFMLITTESGKNLKQKLQFSLMKKNVFSSCKGLHEFRSHSYLRHALILSKFYFGVTF